MLCCVEECYHTVTCPFLEQRTIEEREREREIEGGDIER